MSCRRVVRFHLLLILALATWEALLPSLSYGDGMKPRSRPVARPTTTTRAQQDQELVTTDSNPAASSNTVETPRPTTVPAADGAISSVRSTDNKEQADLIAQIPEIQSTLQALLDRLVIAAQAEYPKITKNLNWTITVNPSTEVNAFVAIQGASFRSLLGDKSYTDKIEITAGFLNHFLAQARLHQDEAHFQDALEIIAGVIAHEMGHSLDYNTNTDGGSQLREARADALAIPLLREAGLPTNSLNRAFRNLSELAGKQAGNDIIRIAKSYLSTHPTNDFRVIQGEIGIVASQMTRGSRPQLPIAGKREAFLAELPHLPTMSFLQKEVSNFPNPDNIQATVLELRKAFQIVKSAAGERYETRFYNYNRGARLYKHLLTRIDDQLMALGTNVPAADRDAYLAFLNDWDNTRIVPSDKDSETLRSETHTNRLSQIPFYQSPEYLAFLREHIVPVIQENFSDIKEHFFQTGLSKLMIDFCPPEFMRQLVSEEFSDGRPLHDLDGAEASARMARTRDLLHFQHLQVPLGRLYHDVLAGLPEVQRTQFLRNFQGWRVNTNNDVHHLRVADMDASESDPESEPLKYARDHHQWQHIESIARDMWADRGYYALWEIYSQEGKRADWPLIFKIAGLSNEEGRRLLNEGLREFLHSERYPLLLKSYGSSSWGASANGRRLATWFDADLWRDLAARGHSNLPEESATTAREVFARRYIMGHTEAFRQIYTQTIRERLASLITASNGQVSAQQVRDELTNAIKHLMGAEDYSIPVYEIQARAILDSSLSAAAKQNLLRELYVDVTLDKEISWAHIDIKEGSRSVPQIVPTPGHRNEIENWFLNTKDGYNENIYRILHQAGVIGRPSELPRLLQDRMRQKRGYSPPTTQEHFELVHAFAPLLTQELSEIRTLPELQNFVRRVYDPDLQHHKENSTLFSGRPITRLTAAVLQKAASLNIDADKSKSLFVQLTQHGSTLETDRFFENSLHTNLQERQNYATHIERAEVKKTEKNTSHIGLIPPIHRRHIGSNQIRARIAKEVLSDAILRLTATDRADRNVRATADRLIALISSMVDTGTARDDLIESLAWALEISDPYILTHIEQQKSTSWRFLNASQIQKGSALVHIAEILPAAARHDAIQYFMNPVGALPQSVVDALRDNMRKNMRHSSEDIEESSLVQKYAGEQALELETAAHSASSFEKIPALMLLMRSGAEAPQKSPEFPKNILRDHLGFLPGSTDEKVMTAYLRTIGADEVPATLAGMMALRNQSDGQKWRPMFEIFTAVGVKGGQLTSIFNLLGPEATAELRSLRDRARPLSKEQIENIFRETLPTRERYRIRRTVRVLGSASMKTVVLVELEDGRQVVAMVQAPHIHEQNQGNLARAKAFVRELRAENVSIPSFMNDVIAGTERQMVHEERMTEEVENVKTAQKMYDKLNSQMSSELAGWRFHVPGPIKDFTPHDHLIFMEYAPGIAHENITDPEVKAHTGRLLLRAGVRGLFRHGILNADPHGGNYLIDQAKRIIHPIDWGQLETYRTSQLSRPLEEMSGSGHDGNDGNEIRNLSEFLRALMSQDVDEIVRFGERLTAVGTGGDRTALKQDLQEIIARAQTPDEQLIGITDAFSRHEVPMEHKFSFGVLKALLTYQREHFATDGELAESLMEEVMGVLTRNPVATLQETVQNAVNSTAEAIKDCVIRNIKGI